MAESQRVWAQPIWQPYKRHLPPTSMPWPTAVLRTKGDMAYYHPSITEQEKQRMEIECTMNGPLIRVLRHKRMFYMKFDKVVGASDGVETCYLYTEWLTNGHVHGRPITVQQLREKGARI